MRHPGELGSHQKDVPRPNLPLQAFRQIWGYSHIMSANKKGGGRVVGGSASLGFFSENGERAGHAYADHPDLV